MDNKRKCFNCGLLDSPMVTLANGTTKMYWCEACGSFSTAEGEETIGEHVPRISANKLIDQPTEVGLMNKPIAIKLKSGKLIENVEDCTSSVRTDEKFKCVWIGNSIRCYSITEIEYYEILNVER